MGIEPPSPVNNDINNKESEDNVENGDEYREDDGDKCHERNTSRILRETLCKFKGKKFIFKNK